MELWDLYDENRVPTGKTHIRGQELPAGFYHLVVHVWLRNSRGEYLISQRSASRPVFPLLWECVGGSALKGEDSLTAALRETKEEIGVTLSPGNGTISYTKIGRVINGVRSTDILDAWLFSYDGEVSLSQSTTDEVAQVWMSREEIREFYESGQLVHTLAYFFDHING